MESLEKVPRYQEHDIFISQDVPNNRLNALIVKYQARGIVVHVMLDLPKEPNMQVRSSRTRTAGRQYQPSSLLGAFGSSVRPGMCTRL